MTVIWLGALFAVAVGPIEYPGQPSAAVLTLVALGLATFLLSYRGGKFVFDRWFTRQVRPPELSVPTLNNVMMAVSLFGIVGIALVALDRTMLSGISNGSYAELLRCAPGLVDTIAIKRTPLLYAGYAMFSFGFASVVLFLLKGEEIRGWPAALAQVSMVSPVGYALLYSGRMPILFVLVLVAMAMLVRLMEGRTLLPRGHYLLLKTVLAVGLFVVYSSAIWASRQNFCIQMAPLITELQDKNLRDASAAGRPALSGELVPPKADAMAAIELNKRVAEARAASPSTPSTSSTEAVLAMMLEAWDVKPRGYVTSAIESGRVSGHGAMIGLSTYFYLTHGVRTVDIVWKARNRFTPQWGLYEVGVLSPLLRIFFPGTDRVALMEAQQRAELIYGFFPSAWAAAFIDFGLVGAILYIAIWGGLAGWSAAGTRHSLRMTPVLLLVFVLASIVLSPVQGPLGIANSALVLVSMLVTGLMLDFANLRERAAHEPGQQGANGPAT
ncbi:hypothetical protein IVB16_13000 [Bradyrhizobium sp. 183]|nr:MULTISPECIES: hypothetical protein [unclassified Bradyrhizobium]MCK1569973.1 hypothetical protein [Bradyrhizobium sp. 173]MCK1577665.1 hypothetical protein [Bradyrhizobium sp. 174]UPJ82788.1 hypothetical protein IVB17_13000 [Bradyrhizobium sp. 184]UPJ90580.1 hypothetical protein IVB16_13000 [Bradyrhizobium sp. 183]